VTRALSSIFEEHGISMPWGSAGSPKTTNPLPTHDATESVERLIEFIRRCLLDGLMTNFRRSPPTRQFPPKLSAFSYIADMYSSHSYRFLREHLTPPSENTLRTKHATRISQFQDYPTDVTRIEKMIADYISHYASFPKFLLCILYIDTFPFDPNSRKPTRLVSDIQGLEKRRPMAAIHRQIMPFS
jgi:hypothetical protein